MVCSCGSNDVHYDEARAESVCRGCGTVLKESAMVDSLSFWGGGKMAGQFYDKNTGSFAGALALRSSSEASLARGHFEIQRLVSKLRISDNLVEQAKRLYQVAFRKSFTSGRQLTWVASAVLYTICRKNQVPYMLMDFSDATMIPIRKLGRVFLKLLQCTCCEVPNIDPSLFMERFAEDLDLGNKKKEVAATGVKLVQAMTRDWIATGRRPTGLCGAALLIASRFHGFRRDAEDVADIVRLRPSTLETRLEEFSKTAAAKIPVKDFETTAIEDLPQQSLPPCALKRKRPKPFALMNLNILELTNKKASPEPAVIDSIEEVHELDRASGQIQIPKSVLEDAMSANPSADQVSRVAQSVGVEIREFAQTLEKEGNGEKGGAISQIVKEVGGQLLSNDLMKPFNEVDDMTPSTVACTPMNTSSFELALSDMAAVAELPSVSVKENDDQDDLLSEIPDDLVDSLILPPELREQKALMWDETMKEVMPGVYDRMQKRLEKRRRAEERNNNGTNNKRQRRTQFVKPQATAATAARLALEEKSGFVKHHMDMSQLNGLFATG